jgi:hypothetical protein
MRSMPTPTNDTANRRRLRQRQGGFIITVELILITTILIIGSFAGIVAIRDALRDYSADRAGSVALISDANGVILGPAVDYDEHEAPRIPYIDRSVPPLAPDPEHRNYRALIGVRDDRFTGREPVYYSEANCTGTPCIKASSDELTDSRGLDGNLGGGSVGYIYALQSGPTYAIGSSPDGIQGFLFRQAPTACPAEMVSRYVSQKVVAGSPCEAFSNGSGEPFTDCLVGTAIADVLPCSCPSDYADRGDLLERELPEIDRVLNNAFERINRDKTLRNLLKPVVDVKKLDPPAIGTICCPQGSTLESDSLVDTVVYLLVYNSFADLLEGNALSNTALTTVKNLLAAPPLSLAPGELRCVSSQQFSLAEEVADPNDASANALERFQAPFTMSLPADVSTQSSSGSGNWIYTAPRSEAP